MNLYEKSCKEWLKGCSCAGTNKPEECEECTKAFLENIKNIKANDKPIKLEVTDIKKEAKERYGSNSCSTLPESVWGQHGFIDGAKWILEKLDSNSNASL